MAAAVAVAARRSRMMFGRQVAAMRWLGSKSARSATARIGVRIGDVEEASAKCAGPAELRNIVVAVEPGVEAGIVGLDFVGKELQALAGCTATFCSCLGTAQDTVLVGLEVEDSLGSHHGLAVVVDRSCRIVVRCQSSSFPCRLEDSLAQR